MIETLIALKDFFPIYRSERMSSFVTVAQAVQEIENWLQLATLFHDPIKEALLAILHNDNNDPSYAGIPRNPTALNAFFRTNRNKMDR